MFTLLDKHKDLDRFLEKKPESSYPESINKEIQLLRTHPEGLTLPFGSATYRVQQYPGDVDLFERYIGTDLKQIGKKFSKSLQQITKKVVESRSHYYSEIKAGIDIRYKLDIGELKNGKYYVNGNLEFEVQNLFNLKLISEEDFKLINLAIRQSEFVKDSYNNFDIVYYLLRKYLILRWSCDEILKGEKKLPAGLKISLENAVKFDSLIKIDEIALVNNRFIEITNAFFLEILVNDKIFYINQPNDILLSLPLDIEKLYYSDMWYSPFKAIKRIFALCRSPLVVHDPKYRAIIEKILPFISSGTSLVYQIKSELDAILVILKVSNSIPGATINKQIDSMKFRLSTVIEITQNYLEEMNVLIDTIVVTNGRYKKMELIESLMNKLKKIINYNTILYLTKVNMNPLPKEVLPPKANYNWNIVRTPDSDPINPLKKLEKGIGGSLSGVHSDVHTNPYGGYNMFDFY